MSKPFGYKIAVALTTVLQAGISAVVPVGICILGARFLVDKFSLPEYTTLIGIILGVLSGFYSMIKYIYSAIKATDSRK